jgi:hypothetical protein
VQRRSAELRFSLGTAQGGEVLPLASRASPPAIEITYWAHGSTPGYIFVAAKKGADQLVWFSKNRYATDFKVQTTRVDPCSPGDSPLLLLAGNHGGRGGLLDGWRRRCQPPARIFSRMALLHDRVVVRGAHALPPRPGRYLLTPHRSDDLACRGEPARYLCLGRPAGGQGTVESASRLPPSSEASNSELQEAVRQHYG